MEDNPIYGNLSYMQTSKWCLYVSHSSPFSMSAYSVMLFSTGMTLFTNADPPQSRDQQRVNSGSKVVFTTQHRGWRPTPSFASLHIPTNLITQKLKDLFSLNVHLTLVFFYLFVSLSKKNKKIRIAMPTWPWRLPGCSLATPLHRYSTQM